MRRLLARRLARLEEALRPPVRHATLKDLLLVSMGRPVPEGVGGGPLVEAILATARSGACDPPTVRLEATQARNTPDECGR